jgi:hypothetical protein
LWREKRVVILTLSEVEWGRTPAFLREAPQHTPSSKIFQTQGEFVQTYELASTTGASTTLPFRVTTITTNPTTTDPNAATCALLIPQ